MAEIKKTTNLGLAISSDDSIKFKDWHRIVNGEGQVVDEAGNVLVDKSNIELLDAAYATIVEKVDSLDTQVQGELKTVTDKIPSQASSTNQLADKEFVNDAISTATATFRGTVASKDELKKLAGDLNDYAYLKVTDSITGLVTQYDRYKYTPTTSAETGNWLWEYTLNNSSFTEAQWKAISSGITEETTKQIETNKTNLATVADTFKEYTEQTDSHLETLDTSVSDLQTNVSAMITKEASDVTIINQSILTLTGNLSQEESRAKTAEEQLGTDLQQTAEHVDEALQMLNTNLDAKQDKLIAGTNIIIKDNVISAVGGEGGGSTVSVQVDDANRLIAINLN